MHALNDTKAQFDHQITTNPILHAWTTSVCRIYGEVGWIPNQCSVQRFSIGIERLQSSIYVNLPSHFWISVCVVNSTLIIASVAVAVAVAVFFGLNGWKAKTSLALHPPDSMHGHLLEELQLQLQLQLQLYKEEQYSRFRLKLVTLEGVV